MLPSTRKNYFNLMIHFYNIFKKKIYINVHFLLAALELTSFVDAAMTATDLRKVCILQLLSHKYLYERPFLLQLLADCFHKPSISNTGL
jgi:hypothetical protein